MPTINELPPAISVSDTDELAVLQSNVLRNATRAQILSGVQTALALPSGNLLGRMSGGVGAPEAIAIGQNLSVGNGALNAPPPFVIEGLGAGGAPMATDQVPIGQGGQNAVISYAAFMAGLPTIPGIDGSRFTAQPTGTGIRRNLADYFSDAVTVESFGAAGDGVTDDTAAFVAALASGRPLRLDGRTYIVNGPLQFTATQAIIGVAGCTVVKRNFLKSLSAWMTVETSSIWMSGVQFDAGDMAGGDLPAVAVAPACTAANFVECTFVNAKGPVSGSGLYVSSMAGSSHVVERCTFTNNTLHGLVVVGAGSVHVSGCSATSNGGSGIQIGAGVGCLVRDGNFAQNNVGMSVGGWTLGAAPPAGGAACTLLGNTANSNRAWGIAVSAAGALVIGNIAQGNGTIASGGGMLVRLGESRVSGNLVGGGSIGIDARGSRGSVIADNHVIGAGTGLSVGGAQNVTVSGNYLSGNSWGVLVSGIEPALSFAPTGPVTIASNWIGFTSSQGGGVFVTDAAQGIAIVQNDLNGWGSALPDQALWIHTDAATLRGNRWNNQPRPAVQAGPVAGLQALIVPDTADEILVTAAPIPIASILTAHQAETLGQLVFVKVTNGGAGYTEAQIAFSGTGGGASATAIVSNGQIVWIVVTNAGSGYGAVGSTISVVITGDGMGAAADGYVGLPVLEGRALRLSCNCQVQLALFGTSPPQQSWTGYASTVPAFGTVELEGVAGSWRATAFAPVDYLTPSGDGGVIVQSVGATNLVLRPGHGGSLQIASAAEIVGCTSSVGRGSPLGRVAATPGSDFRNLDGGPGQTFWVKQGNTDATGWVAVG